MALLLESGAAASAADAKGRTAADLAEEQDRQAAARAKEEAERPPLVRPGDAPNPPPLSMAALARVRALLADAGAQRQRRPAAASGSSDEQAAALGPREAFLALAPGDRLRKVERWASLPPDDLDAALAGFEAGVQAEVQSRLEALRTTAAHLNIHKVHLEGRGERVVGLFVVVHDGGQCAFNRTWAKYLRALAGWQQVLGLLHPAIPAVHGIAYSGCPWYGATRGVAPCQLQALLGRAAQQSTYRKQGGHKRQALATCLSALSPHQGHPLPHRPGHHGTARGRGVPG